MQLLLNLLGLVSSLLLSFISSGMETALYRVSRVRMRIRAEQGEARARLALAVLDRLDGMVTTILINNNIAAYTGTYFLTVQLVSWQVPHSEIITTAVITPLFFVLTESLPKQIAYNNADRFTLELVRVFAVLRGVLLPVVWLLNKASGLLRRLVGSHTQTTLSQSQRTLLMEHLNAGVAEKLLTEEQNRMAIRIMQLEGISAGDSMIPLRKLLLLPLTATRARAVAEMGKRHTQIALLVDPAGRPTSSVVTAAGLLMRQGGLGENVAGAAERLDRIRAGVAIPEVLNLFRQRHARHALVVQGSRVVGLITTQTVLDRIAGIS
ncbi:MAG: CNNM domain-containing protein [Planctomycetaceae bacterium]|nr:CNNM domain-containing protein [Planctomycetaceae bacterium]